ncbi:MAG: NAD(P)-binding domain-containing protein [Methylacidiphilales bacterium]|nr:NAD(P)-binding domain-containing protein [Candidatus Methylacidiphilales bacterium]NJR16547.1 NAD(P)-binding domain-containing protein [Calothrix sp. CSU_2_0]
MKIGIIGAGNIGTYLGKIWAAKGHQILFSYGRDKAYLQSLAESIGLNARAGTPTDAVKFGDVVMITVPSEAVENALSSVGSLANKIILCCPIPTKLDRNLLEVGESVAEKITQLAPSAKVVGCLFYFPEFLCRNQHNVLNQSFAGYYCGNDIKAKVIAEELIEHLGLDPVDIGELENSSYLEIQNWFVSQKFHMMDKKAEIILHLN